VIRQLCTCNTYSCSLSVEIEEEEALRIGLAGEVIIVHGCRGGPDLADALIERREGYDLYADGTIEVSTSKPSKPI
jgi:hypothetical protein